jgi:methyl-accepting chemotaxis protein
MREEILRLGYEMRANFELTWGLQRDMTTRLEAVERKSGRNSDGVRGLSSQVEQLAAQMEIFARQTEQLARQTEQAARQMEQVARQTAKLATEFQEQSELLGTVTEASRRTEGHFRQQGEHFQRFLQVVTDEFAPMNELQALEARIELRLTELEKRLPA